MSNKMGRQAKFQNLKFIQSHKRREPYVCPSGVNKPREAKMYGEIGVLDNEELEKELGRKAREYYEKGD